MYQVTKEDNKNNWVNKNNKNKPSKKWPPIISWEDPSFSCLEEEKSLTAHVADYIQIECLSIWLTDLCFLLFYFQPDKSMDDGYFKVKLKKMSPDVPDLKQFFDVPQ